MRTNIWRVIGLVSVAVVLRPPVTSVGPVVPDISLDLGLGALAVSLLTTMPVVCFGTGAFLGPALMRKLGRERLVAVLLFVMAVVLAARVTDGPILLYAGTLIVGLAIAVGNVVVPALVKQDFPHHIGLVTGVYTGVLAGSAALSAALSVPVAQWHESGWRASLGLWALVALIAFLLWLPQVRGSAPAVDVRTVRPRELLRNPTAWAVTAFMGLQSLGFYAMVAWLPALLQDRGSTPVQAGLWLSLLTIVGVPFGLIIPARASRQMNQVNAAIIVSLINIVGAVGLWLDLPYVAVWIVILGIGQSTAFPLALTFIGLRSANVEITGQLSAMSQGLGYLIAALGPVLMGALLSVTGDWFWAMALMVLAMIGQLIAGIYAGRNRLIG